MTEQTRHTKDIMEQFDLVLWQKVQKKFADLMDLPIVTIDEEGNELIISGEFPRFCKTVKANTEGHEQCRVCRKKNFDEMCKNGQTILFYKCHANLLNIMVPVIIGKQAIGAVVASSIAQRIRDVSACKELSDLLNLNKQELEDMLATIKPKSKEELERYGTLLYALSQTVPELIHAKKISEQLALTDKLTGLYNRRYFMDALEKETARAKRFFKPLSLMLIDVDHFGKYNNNMGHPKGDILLKKMADIFRAYARPVDIIGRYGGEEFIIIMPECNEEHASIVAERIRSAVDSEKFDGQEGQPGGNVTISAGCITSMDLGLDAEQLIKEADNALYEAKNTGRNKVTHRLLKDSLQRP